VSPILAAAVEKRSANQSAHVPELRLVRGSSSANQLPLHQPPQLPAGRGSPGGRRYEAMSAAAPALQHHHGTSPPLPPPVLLAVAAYLRMPAVAQTDSSRLGFRSTVPRRDPLAWWLYHCCPLCRRSKIPAVPRRARLCRREVAHCDPCGGTSTVGDCFVCGVGSYILEAPRLRAIREQSYLIRNPKLTFRR
jgi:hypothetical protein